MEDEKVRGTGRWDELLKKLLRGVRWTIKEESRITADRGEREKQLIGKTGG